MSRPEPTTDLPSAVEHHRHWFDDVADAASHHVSTGPFFAATSALVGVWLLIGWGVGFTDRWLNIGGTSMVVITFVLLAILENAQRRSDKAIHRKLNVLLQAVAELVDSDERCEGETAGELRVAAGIEDRESTR